MSNIINRIRQQPVWIAVFIFLLLCAWIASGMLSEKEVVRAEKHHKSPIPKVRVTRMTADRASRSITLYGRTEPNRYVTLRSEVKGQVLDIYVKEGQRVTKGQQLLRLDENDLKERLASAKAMVKQREMELEGAESLGAKGYQSQVALSQAEANIAEAKASVASLQNLILHTMIVAPFDGVINQRFVEIGDLLREGDDIATVVDLDPLVISADVTENNVQHLSVGQTAFGRMISGKRHEGTIRYISSVSDTGTNTFKLEVEIANPELTLSAGVSTELSIPLEQTMAIKITPAVMALDEQGNLGVKVVVDKHVHFIPIDMIKSDSEGVWLAGLGERADVITLGQGFVRDGDEVDPTYSNDELQASK